MAQEDQVPQQSTNELSFRADQQPASASPQQQLASSFGSPAGTELPTVDPSTLQDAPSDSSGSGIMAGTQSFWSKANAVLDTSPLEQAQNLLGNWLDSTQLGKELNHPVWMRSQAAQFVANGADAFNQLLESFTTPKQVGIALGSTEYAAFAAATNLWYAGWGLKDLLTSNPNQPWSQRIAGGVQAALSAYGLHAIGKTAWQNAVQEGFGIKGDLKERVADKIEEMAKQMSAYSEDMQNATVAEREAAANFKKGESLTASKLLSTAADEALVLKQNEEGRFHALFNMSDKPVTTKQDLRMVITNALADHGLNGPIPSSVFKWIINPDVTMRPLSADEETAVSFVQKWLGNNKPDTIRAMLLMQGFDPGQADLIMAIADPNQFSMDVTPEAVNNTKVELYARQAATKGTPDSVAWGDAAHRLDGLLDRYYAKVPGGTTALKDAREAYDHYINGVGQGVIQDLLFAHEQNDRNIAIRISQILSVPGGDEIRSVLSSMGIDTEPLKSIVEQKEAYSEQAVRLQDAIKASSDKTITAIDARNSIIPGRGDISGLTSGQTPEAGRSASIKGLSAMQRNQEIRLEAIQDFVRNSRAVGIKNPGALISTVFGGLRVAAGSSFGLYTAAGGATRLGIAQFLRNVNIDSWVIQEAEVDPSARNRVLKTLHSNAMIDTAMSYIDRTGVKADSLVPAHPNILRAGTIQQAIQTQKHPPNPDRLVPPVGSATNPDIHIAP